MRNVRLVLEYDGTDFAGWQRQANARTVQEVVETAIASMVHEPVLLRGAGRTDAGVHARAQVANFHTASRIPCEGLQRGLNGSLPADVAVTAVDDVAEGFDSRRSARGKHYAYRVWNAPSPGPPPPAARRAASPTPTACGTRPRARRSSRGRRGTSTGSSTWRR